MDRKGSDEKPDGTHEDWLDASWQATPMKTSPTAPKLIPIVTTASEADAVELAHTYTSSFPAQENAIRDCAPFRREIGYLPKAGEVESETSRTTPDPTRKLGKGQEHGREAEMARRYVSPSSASPVRLVSLTDEP